MESIKSICPSKTRFDNNFQELLPVSGMLNVGVKKNNSCCQTSSTLEPCSNEPTAESRFCSIVKSIPVSMFTDGEPSTSSTTLTTLKPVIPSSIANISEEHATNVNCTVLSPVFSVNDASSSSSTNKDNQKCIQHASRNHQQALSNHRHIPDSDIEYLGSKFNRKQSSKLNRYALKLPPVLSSIPDLPSWNEIRKRFAIDDENVKQESPNESLRNALKAIDIYNDLPFNKKYRDYLNECRKHWHMNSLQLDVHMKQWDLTRPKKSKINEKRNANIEQVNVESNDVGHLQTSNQSLKDSSSDDDEIEITPEQIKAIRVKYGGERMILNLEKRPNRNAMKDETQKSINKIQKPKQKKFPKTLKPVKEKQPKQEKTSKKRGRKRKLDDGQPPSQQMDKHKSSNGEPSFIDEENMAMQLFSNLTNLIEHDLNIPNYGNDGQHKIKSETAGNDNTNQGDNGNDNTSLKQGDNGNDICSEQSTSNNGQSQPEVQLINQSSANNDNISISEYSNQSIVECLFSNVESGCDSLANFNVDEIMHLFDV